MLYSLSTLANAFATRRGALPWVVTATLSASDGRVRGYCAVAKQYVDFVIETQLERKWWQEPEYRAKQSSAMKKKWQDPEYRAKQIATHIGRHPTAETKAKISAVLTRRQNKKG